MMDMKETAKGLNKLLGRMKEYEVREGGNGKVWGRTPYDAACEAALTFGTDRLRLTHPDGFESRWLAVWADDGALRYCVSVGEPRDDLDGASHSWNPIP